MTAFIYSHFKFDDLEPFYVGIGRKKTRAYELKGRNKWHRHTVNSHGIKIEIIAELLDWNIAQWWEKRWIKALKECEYKIVNQTPGGDGGPTWVGRKHTEETKKKMSLAAAGNKGNLGKIFSEEHRKKLSISQIGNKKAVGHKDSEETRLKKSIAQKGKKHALGHKWTEDQRLKNISVRKGQKRTEEQKQRMRDGWINRRLKKEVYDQ